MTTTLKHRSAVLMVALATMLFAFDASARQADRANHLDPYTGIYVLPSGVQLVVSVQHDNLAVSPLGKAASRSVSAAQEAFNRQAETILSGFARNDTSPLRAAMAPHRSDGAADIERLFSLFEQGYGPMKDYRVMGTVARDKDRAWTLAHITFENGNEVIRLSWKDGHLMTIQRGAYPASAFQHVASARFESAKGHDKITFNLRSDGAVESMTVAGRHGAVTAYKLGDLAAMR